jgi:HAD superfamily hydrolase (TIGR01490 family)
MRVAVFDLDGTLTRHDTLWPYLRGWVRRHPRAGFWAATLAAAARYPFDRDRGRLKTDLMRAAMGGAARGDVAAWTSEYVAALGETDLCPGAIAQLGRHAAAGDRLVLLSASVDLYVPAIGRRFGFHETVCTEVRWQGERLEGSLASANRRGPEKRRCIEALRARYPGLPVTAYGNTASDLDHFAAADQAVLVNAGPALRRQAKSLGYGTAEWRNKLPAAPVQSS